MTARRDAAGGGLLHPVVFVAVAVLVLNDHVLKGLVASHGAALARAITGKLSDVAGLCYFPLALQAVVELGAGRLIPALAKPRGDVLVCAALATAAVFCAIKLDPVAAATHVAILGALLSPAAVTHTMDPSDVFAIPMVGVAVVLGHARCGARRLSGSSGAPERSGGSPGCSPADTRRRSGSSRC